MSERPLDGRTALVAGAGPNIGAGIALALAEAGAFVWPLDRDRGAAESCARAIAAAGGRAAPLVADVADPEAVEAAVATASERGLVDVLVNGTAVYNEQGVLEMSAEDWARQLEVTLTGAFLLTKAVTSRLVAAARPGSVINLGSTAGHQGQPGNIAYCSAKGGLLNFTRSAAMELAAHGIRVNSLTPTATGLEELEQRAAAWGVPAPNQAARERKRRSRSLIPLGRLPLPGDYGQAAVFLASDAANSITGIDLPVDGGALARYWAWHPDQ